VLEGLARRGRAVVAHLGYAPQKTPNRRYGGDLAEAATCSRRRGARATPAPWRSCSSGSTPRSTPGWRRPQPGGLPVYAIFSGAAPARRRT
jgi:hypothetical protein